MTKGRAVIIGGGIAGPVAAMALRPLGLDVVVCEAQDAGADGAGAFLTLAVNGLNALDVLDLGRPVRELGMDTPAMTIANGHGRTLGTVPMQGRTVARGDLHRALRHEAERRGVQIQYGARLVDAATTPGGVRAVFADGSTAEGDLLVGADGMRSRTRTLIDPAARPPTYLELLNTGGVARGVRVPGPPGVAHFVFGRRCFFGWFLHPEGDVWWFANPPRLQEPSRDELRAIGGEEWRARVAGLFAGDRGPMLELIAATERIHPPWATYDLPTVRRWHRDRMLVIGDAAHATSPSSGQGASQAIEDGVELGSCLRDAADPDAAFEAFTRRRRERVERVVRQGRRNGNGKADGPVRARIRDLVMPLVLRRVAAGNGSDWMYNHRIDWDGTPG